MKFSSISHLAKLMESAKEERKTTVYKIPDQKYELKYTLDEWLRHGGVHVGGGGGVLPTSHRVPVSYTHLRAHETLMNL
eukprot:2574752-Prymnesium_polylepis.1